MNRVFTDTSKLVTKIIVHPLVLLNVSDHKTRLKTNIKGDRVIGVLLGYRVGGDLEITNSYAIPYDEVSSDTSLWFVDTTYLEKMFEMFRKVMAKERIVGWYHSGTSLRQNDMEIHKLFKNYCSDPILVIIQAVSSATVLPTQAYRLVGEMSELGVPFLSFSHIPSEIGAEEAEEVGVEHLLRDIGRNVYGTLSSKVTGQIMGLHALSDQLKKVGDYLAQELGNGNTVSNQVVFGVQQIFAEMPDIESEDFRESFNVKVNDRSLMVYVGSLLRSVVALHNLINNKIEWQKAESTDGPTCV